MSDPTPDNHHKTRLRRFALATFLTVFNCSVMAAQWVVLEGSRKAGFEDAVDLDSVRVRPENSQQVEVTSRSTFDGRVRHEIDSLLDCKEVASTNMTMRIPDIFGGRKLQAIDLSEVPAGKREADNRRAIRYSYPSWRNAVLHRAICPRLNPSWEERWTAPPPAETCKAPKSLFEKLLCSGDREVRGDINLMIERLVQIQAKCPMTKEGIEKIVGYFYDRMTECKDETCLVTVTCPL